MQLPLNLGLGNGPQNLDSDGLTLLNIEALEHVAVLASSELADHFEVLLVAE